MLVHFAITSGDYIKEQIYEKYLNDFIAKKEAENPNFINEIKLPLYQFRRMLVEFSNQLYNKSIDIKKIKEEMKSNEELRNKITIIKNILKNIFNHIFC